jgi:hypothetical protein
MRAPCTDPPVTVESRGLMPSSTPWMRQSGRAADIFAVAVLVCVAIIASLTFRDYGLGWDDYTHSEYGELLFDLYASGFTDQRALHFVNLYAYGGGFDLLAATAAKLLPFGLFETRRLIGALVGIFGLFVTWRLARRVGGPLAGVIAIVLLATCPLYYGHMFINAKDTPFAVAMAILLSGLVRSIERYPTPSTGASALLAAGIGLAIGTRILGVFGGIYAVAALAFLFAADWRQYGRRDASRRLGRFTLRLLPWFVPAYALMALVWPWSVVDPLNPGKALLYFSHFFETPWRELFDSAFIIVVDMPRRYLPQLLMLTLPEILLALASLGVVGSVIALVRGKLPVQRRAILMILVLAALFPIVLTVAMRPAMYNGIRHFQFIVPPMAVLGGLAGDFLITRLAAWRPAAAALAGALIILACVPPVVAMARLHPYEYVHFNQLAGGTAAARDRYMLDYWGLSFKQVTDALRDKLAGMDAPPGRRWHVATCGPHPPAKLGLPGLNVDWDPRGADFALMLGEYYCQKLDAPIVAEVVRDGISFARVYDIRGLDIVNLLHIPAPP